MNIVPTSYQSDLKGLIFHAFLHKVSFILNDTVVEGHQDHAHNHHGKHLQFEMRQSRKSNTHIMVDTENGRIILRTKRAPIHYTKSYEHQTGKQANDISGWQQSLYLDYLFSHAIYS